MATSAVVISLMLAVFAYLSMRKRAKPASRATARPFVAQRPDVWAHVKADRGDRE